MPPYAFEVAPPQTLLGLPIRIVAHPGADRIQRAS